MTVQIAFDGTEIPLAEFAVRQPRNARLTAAQREALRLARRPEGVRAVEAGAVMHSCRRRSPASRFVPMGERRFWSTDGSAACRRLMKRGLLEQPVAGGPYRVVAADASGEPWECPGQTSIEDAL